MLTISKAHARFEAIFNLVAQTFYHKPTTLQQYEQYKTINKTNKQASKNEWEKYVLFIM